MWCGSAVVSPSVLPMLQLSSLRNSEKKGIYGRRTGKISIGLIDYGDGTAKVVNDNNDNNKKYTVEGPEKSQ